MLVPLRILPPRRALAGEERLQGAGDGIDAKPGPPRFLTVDPYVELRNLALVARIRLGDAGHGAHGFQYARGGKLQARDLRTLDVDLDRLTATTKNAHLTLNGRPDIRKRAKLGPQVGL